MTSHAQTLLQWRHLPLLLLCLLAKPLPAGEVDLVIRPVLADKPLLLGAMAAANQAEETWSVHRLSYLISGLALQQQDGQWFLSRETVGWMNAATARERLRLASVPSGRYQALRFHIGLEPKMNDADPVSWPANHALNPNVNGLHWSWQGGYIFMALEGRFAAAGQTPRGYAFHLAREPYRTAIILPVEFEVTDQVEIELRFNAATLIDGPRPLSFAKDGASTHSKDDDPVAQALKENLVSAFSLVKVRDPQRERDPASQTGLEAARLPTASTPYQLPLSPSFPSPALPEDNPLTAQRVELGRRLFHEKALSRDGSLACATCHQTESALSDPRRFSAGVEGRLGHRNAMPLFNLAWKRSFFWDGRAEGLRNQVLQPIEDHKEMDASLEQVAAKLRATEVYPRLFNEAFGSSEITSERLALALENFLLSRLSQDSKFDRAMRGEEKLTELEQRGFDLFMTEREPRLGSLGGDCFHCHGGPLFTDHQFRNNGLAIDESDLGRFLSSGIALDRGSFATPSLRNVAVTAPYMHDGRFATLEEVLDHYSEGVQRTDTLDPNLAKHPDGGLRLEPNDKAALIAFLKTLTDDRFARE